MLLEEVNNAKDYSDKMVVAVRNHKTFAYCGYANVAFETEKFLWLKAYINKVRPITNPTVPNVFVTWSGNAMMSGDVSKRIHNLFEKEGIIDVTNLKKNLSCNIIRKSTSSGNLFCTP